MNDMVIVLLVVRTIVFSYPDCNATAASCDLRQNTPTEFASSSLQFNTKNATPLHQPARQSRLNEQLSSLDKTTPPNWLQ
jgi:hypothetical protein